MSPTVRQSLAVLTKDDKRTRRRRRRRLGWQYRGAALGRIAKLSNLVRTGQQFCPNLPETYRMATVSGHENKLGVRHEAQR